MGWSDANAIFDEVADALIEGGAAPGLTTDVLARLARILLDGDWDTASESLERYESQSAVLAALRVHGIVVACGAESIDGTGCRLEQGHEDAEHAGNGCRWNEGTAALAAEVAAVLAAAGAVPAPPLLDRRQGAPAGFAVAAGTRPGAVRVVHWEPAVAWNSLPLVEERFGRILGRDHQMERERSEQLWRARKACTGYARALETAGWSVTEATAGTVPHLVASRHRLSPAGNNTLRE